MAATQYLQSVCVFMAAGAIALGIASRAPADIIHVPDDYPTIQEAIDAADDGDEVVVADGTYTGEGNRNIDLSGRVLTVHSENGPAACIIDCEQADRAFRFYSSDSTGTVVEGFTITNGYNGGWGGAMLVHTAGNPTVTGCVFSGNSSASEGGAVSNVSSEPEFIGCSFINNSAGTQGGAVYNVGYLRMTDCLLSGNSVSGIDPLYGGGGIYVEGSAATITDCDFDGNSARQGGAIFLRMSHAALTDCDFSDNCASYRGGAIYNLWPYSSPPELERCTFTGNFSGFDGGAIFNGEDAMITVRDCTFTMNSAVSGGGAVCNVSCSALIIGSAFSRNDSNYGGAVYDDSSDATMMSCRFDGNTASRGGATFIFDSSPTITNAAFSGNSAAYLGGGIMVDSGSPDVTDCTFCANEAPNGGGLFKDVSLGAPTLANCILWGDAGGEIVDYSGTVTVSYSDVQGGYAGEGNIDADPLCVRTPDPGPDGDWGTDDDDYGDLRLQASSPCIDAADNEAVPPDEFDLDEDGDTEEPIPFDLDWNPRFVDDPDTEDTGNGDPPIVDMGAYEFQPPECPADFDGDGDVDTADLLFLLGAWGTPDGDVDGDGDTDTADLLALLAAWGECP
jgi:predicted outer membrane repeat protein